ncbi:MAG: hypothetical protein PUE08_03550 [Eubacteriales bacterium]|nr:hypothetical protein [Eubacteriales bacterium]
MWISKQTVNGGDKAAVESGKVTLNDNGHLEAVSTGAQRSVKVYAPYGYSFSAPKGSELLMTRNAGEQVSFACEMESADTKEGEIKITASSGAYIHLKNDGSVIINGLKINSKGEIV